MDLIQINTIKQFEELKDYYYCDSSGNIYSNYSGKLKKMACRHSSKNYSKITLTTKKQQPKTYQVHRIIATAFIPNPENKPEVNHINHVRDDNRVENLEWATRQEQMDSVWHRAKKRKKTLLKDLTNCKVIIFPSCNACCKYLGITNKNFSEIIKRCKHGKLYRGKYIITYLEE